LATLVRAIDSVKYEKPSAVAAPKEAGSADTLAVKALDRLGDILAATGVAAKKEDKPKVCDIN
jgi:hypothetical protein